LDKVAVGKLPEDFLFVEKIYAARACVSWRILRIEFKQNVELKIN